MTNKFLPRGLIAGLQFLTTFPTPSLASHSSDDQAGAAAWYPAIGIMVGGCVAGAAWIGGVASPWIAALLAVTAWVWITGALHIDGLADVADGLGATHRDPARFLEVARDPDIGSFGVVAIVLLLIAKLVFLAELASIAPPTVWLPGLVMIPAWARLGPPVWRNLVQPLGEGRGKAFSRQQSWRWVIVNGLLLCASSLWLEPALLVAIIIIPVLAGYWRWRLQGMTGDCHGASIEITEVLLLAVLAVLGG